jgi:hypothetical protein
VVVEVVDDVVEVVVVVVVVSSQTRRSWVTSANSRPLLSRAMAWIVVVLVSQLWRQGLAFLQAA